MVTKDGVTVAEHITFEDPFENMGAQIVKQAAKQSASNAGDGTTTATILTRGILNRSTKVYCGWCFTNRNQARNG